MWIFLSVLAFIILLLLLPIYIIIKNDENNNIIFYIKFLFFKFDFKDKRVKKTEKSEQTDKKDKEEKKETPKKDFKETLSQIMKMLSNIFEELQKVFKHLVAKKFQLQIICTSKDAAEAAIHYGECCAVVYPVLGFISSAIKVKEKGRDIDIRCEYEKNSWEIKYHFILSISVCHILAALIRFGGKEIKRRLNKTTDKTEQQG